MSYMQSRHFRNITLWIMVLTLLLGSQGVGNANIWCMAEDGQTHLENILEEHCSTVAPHATDEDPGGAAFGAEENSCGSCFDLAAAHDTLQYRTLSNDHLAAPAHLLHGVRPQWTRPAIIRHLDNKLILELPPRLTSTLLLHRTIVLLI